jgi:hypothetical protein
VTPVPARERPLIVLAALSALQGALLVGYAVFDVVEAVRVGTSGPEEVSNPMSLLGVIVLTAASGAGLLWLAWGWWNARSWARAPFITAQLIIGLLGYEIAQSTQTVERIVGMLAVGIAVIGLVLAFVRPVSRALSDDADGDEAA